MSGEAASERKTRVLVVDDRHENRFLLQSLLESSGFAVELASNGLEALEAARRDRPDLIVSDITMPRMDGFEFCRAVRADPRLCHTPFVFYTATYTEPKDERFALSIGADEFLVKPMGPVEMLQRLREVMERKTDEEPRDAPPDDLEYYREYSYRLVASLERKVEEAEAANRKLQSLNATLEEKVRERTRELERKNEQLSASNRELQAFAYTVAHDLRAPLRAIEGYTTFLAEELGHPEGSGHDYVARISTNVGRMDELIQDLLHYSRVSNTQVEFVSVDLNIIIQQAIAARRLDIQKRNASVEANVDALRIQGVDFLLLQAVDNLMSNALKFVPKGIQPIVRLNAEDRGRWIRLWIEDNGIGIPAEHQQRIFEVFERLHQDGPFPGTGIGLAIVRKAVQRMGGNLGVESEVGKGSRFWLELRKAE